MRPSSSTSCEFDSVDVACRLVTLMSRADNWMTLTPGTVRSRSP